MPRGDAVQKMPTYEEQTAQFKGFTSTDGQVIDPKTEDLNPVAGKNMTENEKRVLGVKDDKDVVEAPKENNAKVVPAKLTDEESEKIVADLDKSLGREATDEEVSKALTKATAEKNKTDAPKPAKNLQDRINKSVKAQRNAERRAESAEAAVRALEARLAALEAGGKTQLTGDTKKVQGDTVQGAPDPKAYEYGELDTKYIKDLARYEAKQAFAEQTTAQETKRQTAQQQEAAEKFKEAVNAFEDAGNEQFEDFDEVVMQGVRDKAWPLSDALGSELLESEFGPAIAYELASDVKLAVRVSKMTDRRQLAWLGQQEARLSAGSGANDARKADEAAAEAEAKRSKELAAVVTKAPTPITRARGQGTTSAVPGDTTDFAAFEAAAMGRRTQR